jgi:hypothetical protein
MSRVRIPGIAADIHWAGVAVPWSLGAGGIQTRHGGHEYVNITKDASH